MIASKWTSNCKIYQAVIYQKYLSGISIYAIILKTSSLKYDLVVHPGGNPDDIMLKYKGADKLIGKKPISSLYTHRSVM